MSRPSCLTESEFQQGLMMNLRRLRAEDRIDTAQAIGVAFGSDDAIDSTLLDIGIKPERVAALGLKRRAMAKIKGSTR